MDNGPPTPGKRTAYLAPVDRPGSYLQRLQVSVGRLPWKPVSGLQGPGGRGLWGWRCNSGEYLMFAFVFIIRKYPFPQMWKGLAERVHILSTYSPLTSRTKRKSLMLKLNGPHSRALPYTAPSLLEFTDGLASHRICANTNGATQK